MEPFDFTYLPMTLTFQDYDLCKLIFWAISQILLGKALPVKEFDDAIHFDQLPLLFQVITFGVFRLFSFLRIEAHALGIILLQYTILCNFNEFGICFMF